MKNKIKASTIVDIPKSDPSPYPKAPKEPFEISFTEYTPGWSGLAQEYYNKQ